MKYSIIVPVYNVEDYLAECLESILGQSCRDFEVLLINDGSTDESGILCDAYAQQYPEFIKVFHCENSGVNRTRVLGLRQASGDICVFVDSDDALRKDALEQLEAVFQKMDCDMVIYGVSRDADFSSDVLTLPFSNLQCSEGAEKRKLYELMTESEIINSVCRKAAKKEIYDQFLADYNMDLDIPIGEDLYLSLPMMTHAKKITYLMENLYYCRRREGSATHSFNSKLYHSLKIVKMQQERYLEIWGIQDYAPVFYSGVVYKWMSVVKSLLENQKSLHKRAVESTLRELSEDAFFRKAYNNMIPERLTRRDRLLAGWLYDGKIQRLCVAGCVYFSTKLKFRKIKQRINYV